MILPRRRLAAVAVLVRDYDEAIAWYSKILGFEVVEDRNLSEDKRWVVLAQPGSGGSHLLLARADTPEQVAAIGNQSGDRVFLFLETDDFTRDHRAMRSAGVRFLEEPRHEDYGTVAVFLDLYGNKWDLIEVAGS
jgi:catechol 2,3-dioxygenase-like lactoylglutathione lyase family enzyme